MNPKKLRYVTRHFYDLQGLRLLPLGLIVFTNSYRGTSPPLLNTVFSLALLGIILWLYRPITLHSMCHPGKPQPHGLCHCIR